MEKATWPALSFEKGKGTYETLHLWTQIVGKIKLRTLPWINHSWHVTLKVVTNGLTTGILPYKKRHFQISFDLINHRLIVEADEGQQKQFELQGLSVADFYKKLFEKLEELDIHITINKIPNELIDPLPFDKDEEHATYVPEVAEDLLKALLLINDVFTEFRARFTGKCSPVHFFWGSFDLAVTRFSGRKAPPHPGGIPNLPDRVAREAYSQEVSSCGFWPGNEAVPFAAFYSYAYPEPEGFSSASILPKTAYYKKEMGEFLLPYSEVQKAEDPSEVLLQFLESTFQAAAEKASWDDLKFTKPWY
ncbi:DUF5996 family protein [Salinimicrobium soli]|uniref:DUF5996 family protein n=1 Tax=Salinimicrobium soli TaxID=1254399 RepID=UPI003AAA66A5